jgi:hypothetical protein
MTTIRGVGASGAVGPTSGGKVYAFNNISSITALLVAPANTSRTEITFHNPGDTDILIFPQFQQTGGSQSALNVTVAAPGGAFLVYANGGDRTIRGECQGAWFALCVASTGKPLTVLDSNI